MPENSDLEEIKEKLKAAIDERDHSSIIQLVDQILDGFYAEDTELRALLLGNKADALFVLEEYDAALETYSKAFELDRDEPRYLANQAMAKIHLGDNLGAIRDFDGAIFLKPNEPFFLHGRALGQSNLSDYKGALRDIDRILEINPLYPDVLYFRAQVLGLDGSIEASIDACSLAIENANEDKSLCAEIYNLRGNNFGLLGRYGEALRDFKKAGELDESQIDNHIIGYTLLALGEHRSSIQYFDVSVEKDDTRADSFFLRGLAKGIGEDHKGAESDFSAAIGAGKEEPEVFFRRGVASLAQRLLAEAIADFLQAIRLYGENGNPTAVTQSQLADTYFALALAYGARDEHERVVSNLSEAIRLKPSHAHAFRNRAIGRGFLRLYEGALSDYYRAVELDPSLADENIKTDLLSNLQMVVNEPHGGEIEEIEEQGQTRPKKSSLSEFRNDREEIRSIIRQFSFGVVSISLVFPIAFFCIWKLIYEVVTCPECLVSPSPFVVLGVTIAVASAFAPVAYLLHRLNIHWFEERRNYAAFVDTGFRSAGYFGRYSSIDNLERETQVLQDQVFRRTKIRPPVSQIDLTQRSVD